MLTNPYSVRLCLCKYIGIYKSVAEYILLYRLLGIESYAKEC